MRVLVLGGAGYIGSHMVKRLSRAGARVTVFDNLSTGHRNSVEAPFVEGDLRRPDDLARLFGEHEFDVAMHFAASCYVGESVGDPAKYYGNNVAGTLNLLDAMRAARLRRLVFSSSCATYGEPGRLPLEETHPQHPVNPYGLSKLVAERAMADYARAYGLQGIALRYFNAAGCDPEGELGEHHDPETHLIPRALREAVRLRAGGGPQDEPLRIYGTDFPTPDGTCIRDYVHVTDLCEAHLLACRRLLDGPAASFEAYNLGIGQGFSVRQVIEACARVTGQPIRAEPSGRRPGDPAALVASASRARAVLGWKPEFVELDAIVRTAWTWFGRDLGTPR